MITKDIESFLNVEPDLDNDLSVIILDSLKNNSFSFANILYEASKGHGITSSEGCFYVLDQDFPEDFKQAIFYLGEFETSKMSLSDFISYLSLISDKYISLNPTDKQKIEQYLISIKSRYKKFLWELTYADSQR